MTPEDRRNFVAGIAVEDSVDSDCLAIALCSYFSRHMDRPEGDTETEDNFYWGDWVMAKTNAALDRIAQQCLTKGGSMTPDAKAITQLNPPTP